MQILQKMRISSQQLSTITERTLLVLLAFFVLWRGGKALDATWLLMGISWLCTYTYWKCSSKESSQPPFWFWALPISLCVWTIVSFAHTSVGNYGFDEVLRTGSWIAMFFWAGRTAVDTSEKSKKLVQNILTVLTVATFAACLVGVFIYILQPSNRFVGTFFDARSHKAYWPNAWAQYLLLAWPIVFLNVQSSLKTFKSKFTVINATVIQTLLMGFLFGCFLLSFSRGASIALAGQLAVWIFLLFRKGKHHWIEYLPIIRKAGLTLFVALMVFLGVNTVRSQFFFVESAAEKVTFSASEGTSSISERQQFWNTAVSLSAQKPLFGWGPYSFRFLQPRYQDAVLATSDHPHNVFLKLAMERGIPAALLLALLLCAVLFPAYWKWEGNSNVTIQNLDVVPAIIVSVIGVVAHNFIDFNIQFIAIALPFWILLGFLSSLLYKNVARSVRKTYLVCEIFLVTALFAVAIIETPYLITSSLGRHAEERGDVSSALQWYDVSKRQVFSRDLHLSRALLALKENNIELAEEALNTYFEANGEDARAWKLRGDVCEAKQDWVCAMENYEKAYALGKYNDMSILYGMVSTLRRAGKTDVIKERRYEFDSLINDFGLAIAINAHFIALSPNVEQLILVTRMFETIFPESEPQYVALGAEVMRKSAWEQERLKEEISGYLW